MPRMQTTTQRIGSVKQSIIDFFRQKIIYFWIVQNQLYLFTYLFIGNIPNPKNSTYTKNSMQNCCFFLFYVGAIFFHLYCSFNKLNGAIWGSKLKRIFFLPKKCPNPVITYVLNIPTYQVNKLAPKLTSIVRSAYGSKYFAIKLISALLIN